MAPAKHILTLMLGATLALSACSTQETGAAAIVDGTSIREKDVQTVSLELKKLDPELTPSVVLFNLILEPYVLAEADRIGKKITDAQARKIIADQAKSTGVKVDNPSPPTVEFARMLLARASMTDASKTSILTKLGKAKVTVNPRYGILDLKQIAITPTSPNWFKPSTSTPAK